MKSSFRIKKLQADFSGGAAQLERRAATVQNGCCMYGTRQTVGSLDCEMQQRIRLDVAQATARHRGVDGCGKVPRQKYDNVAVAGGKLRRASETDGPATGRWVWINPRGNRAA